MAQSNYYKAEEAYNEERYNDALEYLDKAEEYSGNNHLIQYLRVKSLYMKADYSLAKEELAVFFDIIDPSLKTSRQFKEMVLMVAEIEEAREEKKQLIKAEEERIKREIEKIRKYFIALVKAIEKNDSPKANELNNESRDTYSQLKDILGEQEIDKELASSYLIFRNALEKSDLIVDIRDGKFYRTIKIGSQTWMADNLNYYIEGNKIIKSKLFLGQFYTWEAANIACPEGWHLPNDAEWNVLITEVGKSNSVKALEDVYGFRAHRGGSGSRDGIISYTGIYFYYWSSTEKSDEVANYFWNDMKKVKSRRGWKDYFISCRCLKD